MPNFFFALGARMAYIRSSHLVYKIMVFHFKIFCFLSREDLEVRFKSSKALKEGLYYALLPVGQSAIELESSRQSVGYNKIQTTAMTYQVDRFLFAFC